MFSYLFQSVTKIVFEPLAVTLLLWCVLAFGFFKKKNKVLFRFFTGAVIFMLVWRLACHTVMVSERYAAFLIYPTIICCACFTFKCAPFFRWLFKKFKWEFSGRNAFCRFIPAAVLIGLTVGCLLKTFRINHYALYTKQAAQFYLKHRQNPGGIYVTDHEYGRFSWYAGLKNSEVNLMYIPDDIPPQQTLRNTVELLKNIPGEHYFFFFLDKGMPEPDQESLKLTPDYGSWEIVARYYTTKRKKRELLVARYKPVCPDIQEWQQLIPPLPKGSLHHNSDFEQTLTPALLKALAVSCKKNQIKGYEDLSERPMPQGWWFSIGKWNANNPPDIFLSDKNPLNGKYSLVIDARPPRSYAYCNSWYYFNKRCKYTFFVRGEGDKPSQVRLSVTTRNVKLKKYLAAKRWDFLIEPGKTYRLQGTIPLDTFEKDWQSFTLYIGVRGFVTVDQFTLMPY